MKKLVALLAFLPLLAVAACGDDTVGPSAIHGTYTLESIDGIPLPAPFENSTATDGATTLNSDGSWSTRLSLQGSGERTNGGTNDFIDGTVTFFDQFNASFGGIIRGDTLSVAGGQQTLVYVK